MTDRYDWDGIRERYENGETSYKISDSLAGSPTRQGIEKRAKREGWLKISKDAMAAARNLQSIQNPTFPRAPSDELGKRSPENAARILTAFERGASSKIAAGVVGMTLGELRRWMNEDHQFAREITSRTAQCAGEQLSSVRDAGDWRAMKWLLERDPFSREEFGALQAKNEVPNVICNILRDEVPEEHRRNKGVTVDHETITDEVDVSSPEVSETTTPPKAEPPKLKLVVDSPYPPRDPEGARERDRLERERLEKSRERLRIYEK